MLDHEKMLIPKAISELMDPGCEGQPHLNGIVELDEKFFGGKPRFKKGLKTNDSRRHQATRLGLLGSRLRWTNSYDIKAGKDMDYIRHPQNLNGYIASGNLQ